MNSLPGGERNSANIQIICLLAGLFSIRLVAAALAPLAYDEAYYWRWSQHLALGYYDHPPMVAVLIFLSTKIAGDTELGVRLIFVLLGIPATWAVWRSAAILFGSKQIAFTAAVFFNLTLMVSAGTVLALPDSPLLTASSFALFFLAKVTETGRGGWWLAVGMAVGAALLSKYTAIFFGVSILAWLIIVPSMRRWFRTPWPYAGALVAGMVFAPVVYWNATHDWVSFLKQVGRVTQKEWTFRYLGDHLAAQFGLATPSIFILGWLGIFALLSDQGRMSKSRMLISTLVWPLSIFFLALAFREIVEGNWTSPIFPAFAVSAAVAAHAVNWPGRLARLVDVCKRYAWPVGIALTIVVFIQAAVGVVPLGIADPTARQLGAGWRVLAHEIDEIRTQVGARAVLTTSYMATGWMSFYLPSHAPVFQLNERIRWAQEPELDIALLKAPLLYVCLHPCSMESAVQLSYGPLELITTLPRTRHGVEIERYVIYRMEKPNAIPLVR